ncbi:MAG: serine/threonine-protein kinase [bacterium]
MPELIAGKYEVVEVIGRGGMGTVYKAVQQSLNRVVAVKMLSEELASDLEFRARFQQEAIMVARLNHPNIVAVYDIEPHKHTFCIIMEYIEGESLQAKINHGAPLAETVVARIGAQVGRALNYAHENGIIHRDIKPDNILVTPQGAAKVMDFGIARFLESKFKTQTGVCMGTPKFMSPEQVTGKSVDAQSDLYSLGVCLYYCLTARPPFDGENAIAIATKHLYEQPSPPSEINTSITPAFEKVIMRSLEKNKAARYENGEEMARDLEAAISAKTPVRLMIDGVKDILDGATRRMESVTSSRMHTLPPEPPLPERPPVAERTPTGVRKLTENAEREKKAHDETVRVNPGTAQPGETGAATPLGMPPLKGLVHRWWPAVGAAALIMAALIYAILSMRPDVNTANQGGANSAAMAAYAKINGETSALVSQGRVEEACQQWETFHAKYPGYEPSLVSEKLDWLTAQLPPTSKTDILAKRRDSKGKTYTKNPARYFLAKAYFEGARDFYRVQSGNYSGDAYLALLDRQLSATLDKKRSPDNALNAVKARDLHAQAKKYLTTPGAEATSAAETCMMDAISFDPANYACWLALAEFYQARGYADDALVLLKYIERNAPPGSDERQRAKQYLLSMGA